MLYSYLYHCISPFSNLFRQFNSSFQRSPSSFVKFFFDLPAISLIYKHVPSFLNSRFLWIEYLNAEIFW